MEISSSKYVRGYKKSAKVCENANLSLVGNQRESHLKIRRSKLVYGKTKQLQQQSKKMAKCGEKYPLMSRCPAIGAECN
jgi:glutathionylspermidine synthase